MTGDATPNALQALQSQALHFHRGGRLEEAARLYQQIVAADPGHFPAHHLLGIVRLMQGQPEEACRWIAAALAIQPDSVDALSNYGNVLSALGRPRDALASYERALALKPDAPDALNNCGALLSDMGRLDEALANFDKALAVKKTDADIWNNRGVALYRLGRIDEALASYDKALAQKPQYPEALYNRGKALHDRHHYDLAIGCFDDVLTLNPGHFSALNSKGLSLQALGRFEQALATYDRSLAIKPDFVAAWINRGNTLCELSRFEEAVLSYEKALAIDKDNVMALNNCGGALQNLRRHAAALAHYDRALAIAPDHVDCWNNRGNALFDLGQLEAALTCFDAALAIDPHHVATWNNRGNSMRELQRFDAALACYEQVLRLDPDHKYALSGAMEAALNLCDWHKLSQLSQALEQGIVQGRSVISPVTLLACSGNSALQLACARAYIRDRVPASLRPLPAAAPHRDGKIRLAYLSADFRDHPVGYHIVELLEGHDRSCFDVLGMSLGPGDNGPLRNRVVQAVDRFVDLNAHGDLEAARVLRELGVDIVIDLGGLTQGARPAILAHRPAPVQVSYLGYAGTSGAPFIDYILADKIVAPFDRQDFFAEKIVHLPDSFMPCPSRRPIGRAPTRAAEGLPEGVFVFCAFNNHAKLNSAMFDVWMRLLRAVPQSVLWLRDGAAQAKDNLRRESQARGIDGDRIIFARQVASEDHLARHRLADLFLDNLPYNAHATACDALWAGLPLVTCRGESFAGRVGASLLDALGLCELITDRLDDYEAVALKLARDPMMLQSIREKLAQNLLTRPLFKPERMGRSVAFAYRQMMETARRGEGPQSFAVPPSFSG